MIAACSIACRPKSDWQELRTYRVVNCCHARKRCLQGAKPRSAPCLRRSTLQHLRRINLSQCSNWRSRSDGSGQERPNYGVCAMSASPPKPTKSLTDAMGQSRHFAPRQSAITGISLRSALSPNDIANRTRRQPWGRYPTVTAIFAALSLTKTRKIEANETADAPAHRGGRRGVALPASPFRGPAINA
jgi:hypothetical protein